MIKQIRGEIIVQHYIAPASTAFAFNDVVTRNSSGVLAKATSATPRSELLGLIQQTIAAADADYASAKEVAVLKFHDAALFEADVQTGTLVATMKGLRYDLADHDAINVNVQQNKHVEIVEYLSASKGRVKFITDENRMRLVSYQQTVSVASFTDGGATAGTLALGASIPAGAVFARALVTGITGFAGDTTAVLTIGDGSTADRYNTGTGDVFTTAAAGISVGAPSGTLWHTAAATPTLTVTTGADFTACKTNGLGALTITLFWYDAD